MENASARPSTSVEDYVKVIYDLQERGTGPVTISGMAERLTVSNSSVSGMLRKLNELGLVEHRRYGTVSLTEAGTKVALSVLRRHRLLETYLVAELGYSWDEVHDEAEILEHVVSDKFVDRIAHHLGDPVIDPHGDPIPTRRGRLIERRRYCSPRPKRVRWAPWCGSTTPTPICCVTWPTSRSAWVPGCAWSNCDPLRARWTFRCTRVVPPSSVPRRWGWWPPRLC